MHIKIGYDIEIGVSAPTALIYMLQLHPSREADVIGSEHITISPPLRTDHYQDVYSNHCARVAVPAGVSSVRLRNEAVVFDCGAPDVVDYGAQQCAAADLPVPTLTYLLSSRYCEVDSEPAAVRLEPVRQHRARLASRAGDLRLGAQPCALRLPARPCHAHRAGRLSARAWACAATSRTWRSRCAGA